MTSSPQPRFTAQAVLRIGACFGLAGLLLLIDEAPASAHKGSVDRTVMLEPTGAGLEILIHLQVTGKKRVKVLSVFADQDHDGQWSDSEHARLKANLTDRALSKLVWHLDAKLLELPPPRALLKRGDGGIELLLAWSLPLSKAGHELRLQRLGGDSGHLRLVPGTGRTLALANAKTLGPISHLAKEQTVLISAVVAPSPGG